MKGKFCFSLLLCLLTSIAWSQTRRVTGHVNSDSLAAGVSGVNVTVKGARIGTVTDARGDFSISVPDNGKAVLVFSSVGYNPQEVTVDNKTTINVTLASSSAALDVVVIGYQTIRRKDLTASVSSIGARDLKDVPLTSAAEALNGRLAGVTATTSEGSPDAQVRIRVRGGISITQNNDPLYIVDGVQVENALSIIAPQDIQSIDVLKDAAATAIYGARGANGVIVITTKSGRPGRTVVTYNGYIGVRKLAKELEVMSPYDFVTWQYEVAKARNDTNFAKTYGSTWDTLNVYKNISPIDWQKEVMGRTGISTTHNVSASGGNKKITYNFGYTFNNEKPIVQNSMFNRHILNIKADYNATSKLKVGVTGRYLNQDVTGAGTSDGSTSYARLRNAVKYVPFFVKDVPLDYSDPTVVNPGNGVTLVNPIALSNAEYRRKTTIDYNFSATASYQITKQLSFRSTFGYDQNNFTDRRFFDSITSFSVNQGGGKPIVQLDTVYRKTFNNSNVLTYSVRNWKNKHTFDVLLGEETYDLRTDQRSGQFSGYPKGISHADAFSNQPGTAATMWPGYPVYTKLRYTNLSFFGRINYNFADKYLLSLNARYDGASKFAPGNQWGFFPGGSLAWRVKREKFLENVDFINDLKLRVGYGKIGNNRIGDYLFLTSFVYGTTYYALNNQSVNAYTQNYLANTALQWESLVNRNIGIDISLLKNRLNMSVDVYNNTSDKLLLNAKIAPTFGFTTQLQNVGATSNKGVELQLNAVILQRPRGLNWSANFNISHNKNRVTALSLGQTDYPAGPAWGISGQPNDYLNRVGSPVGSMYGWVSDGFYQLSDFNYDLATGRYTIKPGVAVMTGLGSNVVPGAERFKDLNGDGIIDINDRTVIGDPTPKFSGGLNQQFSYKNWDASIFVNFSYGNKIYNANKIEFTSGYNVTSNLLALMNNRWKTVDANGNVVETFRTEQNTVYAYGAPPDVLAKVNANATLWMPGGFSNFGSGGGNFSYYPSSWAIEDGSFLRLNNVTIGYTFRPHKIVSRLRLYVTGNNLAIWTNYTGYDPEVSVASSGLTPGLDYSAYPKSRLYLFGVQATF
ncbi:SusC/RagA family TonB-linked outer membrane protein [Flavisolibacter ginsenosidimutans]|uniref:TonB-dependent receptor n=1 Tax=Flavisolibacter ginsenosidimutans TaxID=661481 RepID=A0A5B8UNJ6_9BACT|nr:TonB-dependent receptor [Flavisolibacter ginsenosidimutans]QEC58016.1 TonB-dependent receptor [Flavisolibacter ginsenosidimutans]